MPKRIRHCSCPHLPDDPEAFRALLAQIDSSITVATANRVVSLVYGERAAITDHRHDRALDKVSLPDAHGHMRWKGPMPTQGLARVQFKGRRMPAAQWLWLRAGRPDLPLLRTCHDTQCIAPDHHTLASSSDARFLIAKHRALEEFDREHPRINYKPKRWDRSDPRGERCLRGHPLTIYGDPRLRQSYCAECALLDRKRRADRRIIENRVAWQTLDSAPIHTPSDWQDADPVYTDTDPIRPEQFDPEPTLSDLLEAGELGA
jgi:hypothetical protein